MPNPLYLLIPPLLILLSIPLALFAILTSTLAFSTLLIRVLAVYVELGIAIAHNYLFIPAPSKPPTARTTSLILKPTSKPPPTSTQTPPHRSNKKRRTSTSSSLSDQGPQNISKPKDSPVGLGLGLRKEPSMERDFEGVGGWRFPSATEDMDVEDSLWTSMNSRLELPAATSLPTTKRQHRRSLTSSSLSILGAENNRRGRWAHSGAVTPKEQLAMSPMQTSARRGSPEGYFGSRATAARENGEVEMLERERERGVMGKSPTSSVVSEGSEGSEGKGIYLATK